LTPYEVLRLARNLGLTTKQFIAEFTVEGGTILRFRSDNRACSLLNEHGCSVHSDRPAACRVYPLGGSFDFGGGEKFALLTPHPESAGVYGTTATLQRGDTVASFLNGQDIAPYQRANQRYAELLTRLIPLVAGCITAALECETPAGEASTEDETAACSAFEIAEWFDVDTIVEEFCAKKKMPVPTDLDAQIDLHIQAIEEWGEEF
jgi:Fe-S-cluster containining protein